MVSLVRSAGRIDDSPRPGYPSLSEGNPSVKSIDDIYTIHMTNLSAIDLNLLRVLDALLRERSTVRAGQVLGLSQPAVSAALGRLRHALADPILVRQGQGLVATSYAADLELPLRAALRELEDVLSGPKGFDPTRIGLDFRISGTDFFASMLMPALAARLQAEAQGIRVQLVDLVPDNYVEALERQNIDLALIPERHFPSWIAHEPLFQAAFTVIARTGHPNLENAGVRPGGTVPLDLFCALGHVLCSPDGKFSGIGDTALASVDRSRRVVVSVPVFEGVVQTVLATELIALFPRDLALHRARSEEICLYEAPIPIPPPLICMIWHKRRSGDLAQSWLRDVVRDVLAGC